MLTVLFATTTSLLFGFGDFTGGLASRRESPIIVTANSHVVGLTLLALAALLYPSTSVRPIDLALGLAVGVFGGLGVTAMYGAMKVGRMSIVAPITAALSGAVPATFDLLRGTVLGAYGMAGLALAIVAIVVVSVAPGEDGGRDTQPRAILLALLAGTGFGCSFIALSFTQDGAGLWPLVAARVASVVLFGVLARVTQGRLIAYAETRKTVAFTGACDASANVTILLAIQSGPLAVASVLGSLYPVVVILLARIVLGERLLWLQRLGVAAALLAVVLTSLP